MKDKRLNKRSLCLIMIYLILFPSLLWAIPSITGISGNDATMIINGNEFGNHVDENTGEVYINYIWEDFEDQSAQGDVNSIDIGSTNARTGSNYHHQFDDEGNHDHWAYKGFPQTDSVWIDYWLRLDSDWPIDLQSVSCPSYPNAAQMKLHFINNYANGDSWHSYANLQWGSRWNIYNSHVSTSGLQCAINSYYEIFIPAQWLHLQVWFDISENEHKVWANNTLICDSIADCPPGTTRIDEVRFDGLWRCLPGYNQDDGYLSFTKARVEIGNALTYSNCNHTEIQIPTAWSDSSITFTVNQGSFLNGETAYVFVVDADGNASSGKEITIGGTGMPGSVDITPPQDIIDFIATPGDSWISLSWTNPNDEDFAGVMIRYRTDGSYPLNYQDGELACDIVGNPGEADSYVLEGVENGVTYYFSAFSYDEIPNYTQTVHATATPTTKVFSPEIAPVPINSSALPGAVNVHYNSGGRRIVRINNTTIVITPHGTGERIYRSTNNGSSWLEIDTDGAYSGCLITGPAEMVYHFYRSGDNIYMVKFQYDGIPSSPVIIYQNANLSETDTSVYAAVNAIVDADGTLYVSTHWGHPDQLYLIRSTDGGNTWAGPFQISSGSAAYYYPHLEVTANNVLVCTYEEVYSGEMWFAKSLNHGETWSRVLVSDENTYNPSVLTVGTDTVYIFAQSGESAHQGLVYNKSTDQGDSWSGWDLIDPTCGYADPSPALGSDGNTIYVAYRSNNGTGVTDGSCGDQSRSRLAMSPDLGQTWDFIDNNYAAERTGARSQIRYQTFWNYGGPVEWIWMQYENGGTNRPIYYDIKTDANIFVTTASVGEGVPAAPTSLRITDE